ncbi:N-acetylglucosamine kinase [Marivirga salinae]|uniref:N-acetylglucosamine kinase n=1 Tax=Marivirga salinarum TaxID=3059078 RepID=A0AA49GAW6_9BACT|nr:N-acetylglucosamine kinase [Marivirga sp. BDSF4-3]WKK77108.2 N-acetylglucosamine kinase [Marivirga sp. BDSF4-3]
MQLIADSGSSKTDWRLIMDDNTIEQFKTSGINPYLISEKELIESLRVDFKDKNLQDINEINYYGAGCGQQKNKEKIKSVFKDFFKCDQISVEDDMLAAARASCGNEEGIVCILGTGANACHYDGSTISERMISLGYALGDEGSGNFIGKLTLKAYLEDEMPSKLAEEFTNAFPEVNLDYVLEQIYQKSYPNRFFAQFFQFSLIHQKEKFFFELISESFQLFLEKSVLKFKQHQNLPIHFVGGVAFHANSIMRMVLTKNNLTAGNFMESPIAGLTLYHKNQHS